MKDKIQSLRSFDVVPPPPDGDLLCPREKLRLFLDQLQLARSSFMPEVYNYMNNALHLILFGGVDPKEALELKPKITRKKIDKRLAHICMVEEILDRVRTGETQSAIFREMSEKGFMWNDKLRYETVKNLEKIFAKYSPIFLHNREVLKHLQSTEKS